MKNIWLVILIGLVINLPSRIHGQQLVGSKERIVIQSKALQDNLIGDNPAREVSIYLPPGYSSEKEKRFPVLYMLHGFTDHDNQWFGFEKHWINLPLIIDSAIQEGNSREMIIVMPNAYNSFKGSMYSSSVTIGDWETFITKELVAHIDSHYRTLASKESRGLAGHSMGGYGTIRLGMKYPEVYSSLYLLSPCCMSSTVNLNAGLIKNVQAVTTKEQLADQPFFVSATLAGAAAWAPNPSRAPLYLDLPYHEGAINDTIADKIASNATLNVLDQYIYNLKKIRAIAMDAGAQDYGIAANTQALHNRLEAYKIDHQFEIYQGDHINKIGERIYRNVLPFFSETLKFY